ncbi:hypothetical protein [Burkholderia phage vB_BglM_WTB]
MKTFKFNGYTYRVNGDLIEALDGKKWNVTHSLRVRLKAIELGLI